MGFRFWRRVRIAPGISLNLSKTGMSVSAGPRGAKMTVGARGVRATTGLPGTGMYYTTTMRPPQGRRRGEHQRQPIVSGPAKSRLDLGFFQRLVIPGPEKAFVDGLRALIDGKDMAALNELERAAQLADAAYLAGFTALKHLQWEDAKRHLTYAASQHRSLGRLLRKYGIQAELGLPITEEIMVHAGPNLRSVLLGLVEVYQELGEHDDAMTILKHLHKLEPHEPAVKLSIAEFLVETRPDDRRACQQVVQLCAQVDNESPVHAAVLLYKARALGNLGLLDAKRETLTKALRRRKDRPPEVLLALRYERALTYEALGQKAKARKDFERIYAEDPSYQDVADRFSI